MLTRNDPWSRMCLSEIFSSQKGGSLEPTRPAEKVQHACVSAEKAASVKSTLARANFLIVQAGLLFYGASICVSWMNASACHDLSDPKRIWYQSDSHANPVDGFRDTADKMQWISIQSPQKSRVVSACKSSKLAETSHQPHTVAHKWIGCTLHDWWNWQQQINHNQIHE